MKNICFVANYEKTLLFDEIAKKMPDYNIYWVTVNHLLYNHLLKNYPKENILLIDKPSVLVNNIGSFDSSKYKLNELWIGDRVLKHESWGQQYLANLSKIYYDFIENNNIDFIFGEITWAHELLLHRVSIFNKSLNCKFLCPHTVRMPSGMFAFFKNEFLSEIFTRYPDGFNYPKESLLQAKKPEYLALNDKILDKKSKPSYFIKKLKYFFKERIHEAHDPTKPDSLIRAFKAFVFYYINKKYYHWFVTEIQKKDIEDKDFVLFTLHKQPEASIDNMGRYYENQLEIIKNIWRILPKDTLLLVKEHSNAIGDRKLSYYKEISQHKNVKFINYKEDSYALIKMAKAVFTISGTIAYEAALMQTPAFTFIPIYFNRLSLCKHINFDDLRNPSNSLENLVKSVKYDQQNDENYTNWVSANSFQGIIADYNSNPACMEDKNIDKLVTAVKIIISI
ncbi:MAG: hypothetical protein COA97_12115 [Flavobacteriales bacterium]|nr:MAG: hypothetical protein COA97_12115 [Flavobacteriales bacterium]